MSFYNTAPYFLTFIVVINRYSLFKFKIFVLNTSELSIDLAVAPLILLNVHVVPSLHHTISTLLVIPLTVVTSHCSVNN